MRTITLCLLVPFLLASAIPPRSQWTPEQAQQASAIGDRIVVGYQLAREYLHKCDRMMLVKIAPDAPIEHCVLAMQELIKTCHPKVHRFECKMGKKLDVILNPPTSITLIIGPD